MEQDTLRAILHDIAAEAVPTPLADRALRGVARRRKAKVRIGVAVAAGVLAAVPFLLPGSGRATENRDNGPASSVTVPPSPAAGSPTSQVSPPAPTIASDPPASPGSPHRTASTEVTTSPATPTAGTTSQPVAGSTNGSLSSTAGSKPSSHATTAPSGAPTTDPTATGAAGTD